MALIGFWSGLFRWLFGATLPYGWAWLLSQITLIVAFAVCLLIMLAYILLADRKIWAAVQMRKGPNVVGAFGLLQSFADFFKFAFKEAIIPAGANKVIFLLAPFITLVLAFASWAVIPVNSGWVIANINVGVLYILAISSLGVYGIIMGGWASNSKYPFLGGLRSAAQMVSYEVSIGFVLITVLLFAGSLNLSKIVEAQQHWLVRLHNPVPDVRGVLRLCAGRNNRPPFDLPEAESELVAGFMVEYSSTPYLLFMIGEYLNAVLMCAMLTILFFGGWLPPLHVWPLTAVPGVIWLPDKGLVLLFPFCGGEGDRSALPL